jgi:transposase
MHTREGGRANHTTKKEENLYQCIQQKKEAWRTHKLCSVLKDHIHIHMNLITISQNQGQDKTSIKENYRFHYRFPSQ